MVRKTEDHDPESCGRQRAISRAGRTVVLHEDSESDMLRLQEDRTASSITSPSESADVDEQHGASLRHSCCAMSWNGGRTSLNPARV